MTRFIASSLKCLKTYVFYHNPRIYYCNLLIRLPLSALLSKWVCISLYKWNTVDINVETAHCEIVYNLRCCVQFTRSLMDIIVGQTWCFRLDWGLFGGLFVARSLLVGGGAVFEHACGLSGTGRFTQITWFTICH